MNEDPPSLDHLEWLIASRGDTNKAALQLLALFENHRDDLKKYPFSVQAQELLGIAFSLWRAVFLADRKGKAELKVNHAEQFLRKMLVDNAISFAQDRSWKEWAFNYYMGDARLRLGDLGRFWKDIKPENLQPPEGKRSSKERWTLLQKTFEIAVEHLAEDLLLKPKAKRKN